MARAKTIRTLGRDAYFRDADFPLAIVHEPHQQPVSVHRHEFTELVIILNGRGEHVFEDERWTVAAGDVFLLGGDETHGYGPTEGLSLANVLYDPAGLGLPRADLLAVPGYHALFRIEPRVRRRERFGGRLRLRPEGLAEAGGLVERIEAELGSGRPGRRFVALALFMELVAFLSRSYEGMRAKTPRRLLRLGEALGYLERRYAEPIRLEELEAVAHMSGSTLLRAFREVVGAPPIEYLLRLRLRRAGELLRTTELSVTEIAFRVGFRDANYFSRQFRALRGMSPTAWRRAGEGGPRGSSP
jgi:AraC-like DNA-binding protein